MTYRSINPPGALEAVLAEVNGLCAKADEAGRMALLRLYAEKATEAAQQFELVSMGMEVAVRYAFQNPPLSDEIRKQLFAHSGVALADWFTARELERAAGLAPGALLVPTLEPARGL